jgi:hypothetical protein
MKPQCGDMYSQKEGGAHYNNNRGYQSTLEG